AFDLPGKALARHLVQAEGTHELAQDVVRRQVAVLEVMPPGLDLLVDEPPRHVANHQVLLAPLDHGAASLPTGRPGSVGGWRLAARGLGSQHGGPHGAWHGRVATARVGAWTSSSISAPPMPASSARPAGWATSRRSTSRRV